MLGAHKIWSAWIISLQIFFFTSNSLTVANRQSPSKLLHLEYFINNLSPNSYIPLKTFIQTYPSHIHFLFTIKYLKRESVKVKISYQRLTSNFSFSTIRCKQPNKLKTVVAPESREKSKHSFVSGYNGHIFQMTTKNLIHWTFPISITSRGPHVKVLLLLLLLIGLMWWQMMSQWVVLIIELNCVVNN